MRHWALQHPNGGNRRTVPFGAPFRTFLQRGAGCGVARRHHLPSVVQYYRSLIRRVRTACLSPPIDANRFSIIRRVCEHCSALSAASAVWTSPGCITCRSWCRTMAACCGRFGLPVDCHQSWLLFAERDRKLGAECGALLGAASLECISCWAWCSTTAARRGGRGLSVYHRQSAAGIRRALALARWAWVTIDPAGGIALLGGSGAFDCNCASLGVLSIGRACGCAA